ncbi:MAG TPA: CTP synthase [bacterium]|nr:CTP synthase [bacterium]
MKYIFVTGGVLSSLGKGITCASIGCLLKYCGFKITNIKCDPYVNIDPGTMNPYQHGEVFVTEDGAETDLDLGYYERFTSTKTKRWNNMTTGQIYQTVINRERAGEFLGKTVQIIPHITDEIKYRIKRALKENNADIAIVEIGGTVGDIESQPYLEAIRQMAQEQPNDCVFVHLTLVPWLESSMEFKTKPTQHSVQELRRIGIQPDILILRSERHLSAEVKQKIALFCNVQPNCVISNYNMKNLYELPAHFSRRDLHKIILKKLRLKLRENNFDKWLKLLKKINTIKEEINIMIAGKYVKLPDAYKSLIAAVQDAGYANNLQVNIKWIEAEELTDSEKTTEAFKDISGVIVPGGFGARGIEGKLNVIKYARENNIPFLGICLGMQCAVIEFARNVFGLKYANSTEFDEHTKNPIVHILPKQDLKKLGGTMRLGNWTCNIKEKTLAYKIYKKSKIEERHRHRYEVNKKYLARLEKYGMIISGISEKGQLPEIIEYNKNDFFIAVQYHPEYNSTPINPNPIFVNFIAKSREYMQKGK